ncbi:redoxin domain-containing protein [Candidatus Thalassolituus haligoni]|uniref:redoxin domain-containing protein n=1 Tax=Candidatus Thalassolituus haligoni TaxID=3100113 RepID=UPI0035120E00|tara:strand:- start:4449 stop:4967 length:519 start_codon:yes stop_codon:yes gene_type:complete
MEHSSRILLLVLAALIASFSVADTASSKLSIGDTLAELALPPVMGGYAKSLNEQRGKPVMLIWVGPCHQCREALEQYEQLARQYSKNGLVTWVIWDTDDQLVKDAPHTSLPLLAYNQKLTRAWQINPLPAVMLVSPDGTLDYLYAGSLFRNMEFTRRALSHWLSGDGVVHQR